ncbi:unnamed protein product [Aphanomyces euteiches]
MWYFESTGMAIATDEFGREHDYGYCFMESFELPQCSQLDAFSIVRAKVSMRHIFRELPRICRSRAKTPRDAKKSHKEPKESKKIMTKIQPAKGTTTTTDAAPIAWEDGSQVQKKHELQYALQIDERDEEGNVTSVVCKLCKYFGREQDESEKRKRSRTEHVKTFSAPYRPSNYETHMKSQHKEKWNEYSNASNDQQTKFFDGAVNHRNTLHNYLDLDNDMISFDFDSPIIDVIIGDLMFRVEDELAADGNSDDDICTSLDLSKLRRLKQNAMKLFTHQDDGRYKIFIKNVTRFRFAMDFVSKAISFRQTAFAIECVKVRTKTAKLSGINDHLPRWAICQISGRSLFTKDCNSSRF